MEKDLRTQKLIPANQQKTVYFFNALVESYTKHSLNDTCEILITKNGASPIKNDTNILS